MAMETATKRLFIAIHLNDETRNALSREIERLKKTGARVKWTPRENIHLTLAFIGQADDEDTQNIIRALDSTGSHNQVFEFGVRGLGYFGGRHFPRVIWAGLKGMLNPLFSIQEQITTALKTLNLPTDEKRFKPHITLGRVRAPRNAADLVTAINQRKENDFGLVKVDALHLMESVLRPEGAEHTSLHSAPLTPAKR